MALKWGGGKREGGRAHEILHNTESVRLWMRMDLKKVGVEPRRGEGHLGSPLDLWAISSFFGREPLNGTESLCFLSTRHYREYRPQEGDPEAPRRLGMDFGLQSLGLATPKAIPGLALDRWWYRVARTAVPVMVDPCGVSDLRVQPPLSRRDGEERAPGRR
jgi:hypothetical protein